MNNVLLIEDSVDSQELVAKMLSPVCNLSVAGSFQDALQMSDQKRFDLLLMDVMLGDGDGFTLMGLLKQKPPYKNVPVIFLTSKGDIHDKALGFELGAEDYIVKPFDPMELRLRVEARLKKIQNSPQFHEIVRGDLLLDVPLQKAYLVREEKNLQLTPLQFKILFLLIVREPEVLSREQLTNLVWGEGVQVGRSLDTHITALRKKLGDYGACIQSVYGQGYRFLSIDKV